MTGQASPVQYPISKAEFVNILVEVTETSHRRNCSPNPADICFAPLPRVDFTPSVVVINRGCWCAGARFRPGKPAAVDALGAYLLQAGVSIDDLRDAAHLWPWSGWAREVDEANCRAVQAHRIATQWRAHGQRCEQREKAAFLAEQDLMGLFARKGLELRIVGDFVDLGPREPARAS